MLLQLFSFITTLFDAAVSRNGDDTLNDDEDSTRVDPRWLASPMLRFLQTLQRFKVDRDSRGISRADLDNVLLQVRSRSIATELSWDVL